MEIYPVDQRYLSLWTTTKARSRSLSFCPYSSHYDCSWARKYTLSQWLSPPSPSLFRRTGWIILSLRKQLTFCDATTGFPAKWCLRNKPRNSLWMVYHYPDQGSTSDRLKQTTNQKHYSDLGSDTSSVWNFCALFSDAILRGNQWWHLEMSAVFSGQMMRVSIRFFGMRDFHNLNLGIWDFKVKAGRDSELKVSREVGCTKKYIGITGLHEIGARDYGIEVSYWGPSLLGNILFRASNQRFVDKN